MLITIEMYKRKVIPETQRANYIRYLRLYYYNVVDTSVGGLLVPEGIIRPVVSVAITRLIPLLVDY